MATTREATLTATRFDLDPDLDALIARMPKVELHVHLEGTLEPELAFSLAEKNRVHLPYASVDEMRAAFRFTDLQSFLDVYYDACAALVTRDDFRELTLHYLSHAVADNIRHVEPFFDPQTHTMRGVPFDEVIGGILDGLADGHSEYGITSRLIMCFLRDQSEASAEETLSAAEPWIDRIAAVGLDSAEVGNPPEKFSAVFARARALGLRCVAHAGEEGDARMVTRTLDALKVSRIDHGVHAASDPAVMQRLAEEDVTLTVCPNSNVRLGVYHSMAEEPLRTLLGAGVAATVNSDDPAYFGGYLTDNFRAVTSALHLTRDDLYQLSVYAIGGSFAAPTRKLELMAELDAVFDGAV